MVEKDKPLRESIKNLNAPAIIAFGNPLLDMFVKIKDNDLLKKYNLNVDGEAEFSEDKMQELLAHIPQELISIFINNCHTFIFCINFFFIILNKYKLYIYILNKYK